MRKIIQFTSIALFIISLIWIAKAPGYDAYTALGTALIGLISSFASRKRSTSQTPHQEQTVSSGSIGIQAGRDVNVRDIKN
jgi:hypothetical protein